MSATLDELYLRWLQSQVSPVSVKNPARTYWKFLLQLYTKEFVWLVPNDDNRVGDARTLRDEFLDTVPEELHDEIWWHLGASVLEILVALSRRLAFMGGGESRDCFWVMVENAGFPPVSDRDYMRDPDTVYEVDHILDRLVWRTYDYDGTGGLFPLQNPPKDQRKTELWYQMASYVIEMEEGG